MYHLVFDLRTGACLNAIDLPQQRLRTFAVELIGDVVHVGPALGPRVPLAEMSIGA
jgi:nitrite reductase (NADH) large subunit/nitrite reductase (NADH) small subunit